MLGGKSLFDPSLNEVVEKALTFEKHQLVRQYALQKHTNTLMPSHIGRCDQSRILGEAQVRQMRGLRQDIWESTSS